LIASLKSKLFALVLTTVTVLSVTGSTFAQASGESVTYPGNVVDVASLTTAVRTNGGLIFVAAVGVALAFLLARKAVRWMFRAI
jgi:hypothetical protein